MIQKFDQRTVENLEYYVYMLIHPDTKLPFYVWKGKDQRVFQHIKEPRNINEVNNKHELIYEIQNAWKEVEYIIVRHWLTQKIALEVESALIDTFCFIPNLQDFSRWNKQLWHWSSLKGLMTSQELIRRYNAKELTKIPENFVIININKSYQRASWEDAIYEATKGVWKMAEWRKNQINYVLSEYRGLIVGVFKVKKWIEETREYGPNSQKKWQSYTAYAFEKTEVEEKIREKYLNLSVSGAKKRWFMWTLIYASTLEKLRQK